MSVLLSVEGDDPVGALEVPRDWLGYEPGLSGLITLKSARPASGEMGILKDTLVAAVGSGGTISMLAASLKGFLTLPRRSDLQGRSCRRVN